MSVENLIHSSSEAVTASLDPHEIVRVCAPPTEIEVRAAQSDKRHCDGSP
jgi:hypothetical protein